MPQLDPTALRAPEPLSTPADILLSIVVPVYNQEQSILQNVRAICERVRAGLTEPFEIIVVSDGSIDRTEEQLVESHIEHVRFLHYDRNLGKGYAIKVGALDARGRWIAYLDADLDLDPGSLPEYVAVAEHDGLDFAIGSKRHPESVVSYPTSRRVASWLFQRYVKLLLRLDVRDTQVGIKVFRREVADQVLPLLLVKRYAFDIELLAVARAFGFGRVRELPVTLEYKFSGSGVRLSAVVEALADTLAVFYRLRILHTYQRKRALVGPFGWTRPGNFAPLVTLLTSDSSVAKRLDWPNLDVVAIAAGERVSDAARRTSAEFVAVVEPGAVPSGNFVSATVPFLARAGVGAVVTSKVAPATGGLRARAAAAVRESRIGGGSLYFRYLPGNIRYVSDFPTASFVIRRALLLELPSQLEPERVPAALVERGDLVIYTPEAFLLEAPEPLFRPHLRGTFAYGLDRGSAFARRGFSALRPSTVLALPLALFLGFGWVLLAVPGAAPIWEAGIGVYAASVLLSGLIGSLRFRSSRVGLLVVAGLVLTHAVYGASFATGMVRRSPA
jgi:glycosyltransferase involved in cell wall biosynthesis